MENGEMLYKYRPLNCRSLSILRNRELYFSDPQPEYKSLCARLDSNFVFVMVIAKTTLYFSPLNRESVMSKGTVKWFNADKGFGFITPEDGGKDLFVHHSEIQAGGQYATLNDGQAVEFEVGQGQKGPCANKVVAV